MKCHSCKGSGQSTPQLLHARTNTSECWNLHGCIVRKHIFRDLCFNWKYRIIFGSLWNCRGKIIHGNTGVVYEEACFAHNHWLLYESYHLQSIDVPSNEWVRFTVWLWLPHILYGLWFVFLEGSTQPQTSYVCDWSSGPNTTPFMWTCL